MTLGTFVARNRVAGDRMDLRNSAFYNRPYLISAVDFNPAFHSKMKGENVEAVWADILDLQTGSVLVNVLFTNGPIVDNLKENVGTGVILPVKIEKQAGGNYGGYAVLAALTDQEAALANQVYNNGGWNNVTQERARREAAARPMGNVQQNQPQGSPFGGQQDTGFAQAPVGQQGSPFGQAPQGQPFQQNQAPVAQQPFGQPNQAPQQGAPFGGQPQGQPFGNPVQDQQVAQYGAAQNPAPQQGFGPAQGQFGTAMHQDMEQFNQAQAPQGQPFQQNQAPAQGFGQPVQGFQGQPDASGQFGQPQQAFQPQGQAPQQGFGQAQPPANDAAAQQALAQLNSGQFQ